MCFRYFVQHWRQCVHICSFCTRISTSRVQYVATMHHQHQHMSLTLLLEHRYADQNKISQWIPVSESTRGFLIIEIDQITFSAEEFEKKNSFKQLLNVIQLLYWQSALELAVPHMLIIHIVIPAWFENVPNALCVLFCLLSLTSRTITSRSKHSKMQQKC